MKPACEVFCVGNAVADVLARPVESLPPPGKNQGLADVALGPGGNSINTGIALARLGVSVAVAAPLGDDRLGRMIRETLIAEGVNDSNLLTLRGEKTSVSVILVQDSGERRILHFRGANQTFSDCHLNWRLAEGAKIFFYASTFALPAFDGPALARSLAHAKQLGCLTALNTCWDIHDRWLPLIRPALAHTDIIMPNLDEGLKLTGEAEVAAIARRLRGFGVRTVVVKLGVAGCYVEGPEGAFTSPGFPVAAKDTTGAGDCFAAGFLAALCRGDDLKKAARFANAAGALCTLGMGGADSAPTRKQVDDFLGGHG
jgi:sugar/nucleoside kinase (ribokinase family)